MILLNALKSRRRSTPQCCFVPEVLYEHVFHGHVGITYDDDTGAIIS